MAKTPALLVAAPASGQGKTTVVAGLARLHTRSGRRVRVFKCGPDFLDPFWLGLASEAKVENLDLWINGETDIRARLHAAASDADLLIIEGVMGLYDGHPSAADLARLFGIPIMVVIDASAMAQTFGALAYGLQQYQSDLPWAGVLANRVAGDAHAKMLREAVLSDGWLGAVMHDTAFVLAERHLGLTMPGRLSVAMQSLDAVADTLAKTPLGQMNDAALSRWAVQFEAVQPADAHQKQLTGKTIAIARDESFCFIYPANLDTLTSLGARLVFFSPLANESVPECDALWLPGGYPELHGHALANADKTRTSLRTHIDAVKPVWAECGGMMVLFERLVTVDKCAHTMWDVLPGVVTMQHRLAALGPQQLDLPKGALRGHTFHYSRVDSPLSPLAHTVFPDTEPAKAVRIGEPLFRQGSVRASYFHAWFASNPAATASLFS